MLYIYGLFDNETKMIFYVGKSKNPRERFKKHLRYAKQYRKEITSNIGKLSMMRVKCGRKKYPNIRKTAMIAKILSKGGMPGIGILDKIPSTLSRKDESSFENAWIHKVFDGGHNLTNTKFPYIGIESSGIETPDSHIASIKMKSKK